MIKNKKVKFISLVMAPLLVLTVFTGCGSTKSTSTTEQKITYNLGSEPKTIDPGLNSSVEGSNVVANAFEGLEDVDSNNKPHPGVALSYTISDGGRHYVFHLRKNSKWSDGKPVTAKDFEYAWKRALAPETASDYAYQLFYLKNGQ